MLNDDSDRSDIPGMVEFFLTGILDQVATRVVDNLQEKRKHLRQRIMDDLIHETNNLREPGDITDARITSDTVTKVHTREETGNPTLMRRQLQAGDYIKPTGPLHITNIAPPQLDSITTENSNMNVTDITNEHVGHIPKCSRLKTKTLYKKVKFYYTEQVDKAEEKRIVEEDALKRYIATREAIQDDRKRLENDITKRKSIGARLRGALRYVFACKSRRATLDD